jgi:hypothetical protein
MLFSRHVRRMSITRHQLKKYSDPIVKIGFERKLREVSSKKCNEVKERLDSSVEKVRHLSNACRNVDAFSRVAISSSRNFFYIQSVPTISAQT